MKKPPDEETTGAHGKPIFMPDCSEQDKMDGYIVAFGEGCKKEYYQVGNLVHLPRFAGNDISLPGFEHDDFYIVREKEILGRWEAGHVQVDGGKTDS